jgi:hypothetical protein
MINALENKTMGATVEELSFLLAHGEMLQARDKVRS